MRLRRVHSVNTSYIIITTTIIILIIAIHHELLMQMLFSDSVVLGPAQYHVQDMVWYWVGRLKYGYHLHQSASSEFTNTSVNAGGITIQGGPAKVRPTYIFVVTFEWTGKIQ